MNADAIRAAALDVEQRRATIDDLLVELQQRLDPQRLARQVTDTARTKGNELAATARQTAEQRPFMVAAGAGAVLLFLGRKPIASMVRRVRARRADGSDQVTSTILTSQSVRDYESSLGTPSRQAEEDGHVLEAVSH